MSVQDAYRGRLREHFTRPRNQGDLAGCSTSARLNNPLCGDEIEVGVWREGPALASVRFRARACAICVASASLMTEQVAGGPEAAALALAGQVRAWIESGGEPPADLPEPLVALAVTRDLPNRERCVTLPWEALEQALEGC
ncbi:iron-sulfur cluster assembly scaffold protein [Sediminicurvatus halobius]|uniref:SUF system NifU family Fe-S cluster assembly protein n=1 Tax=Sediminicurvatus halobius TaxID=2182432 RepID=A0A2U2N0W0_9GAMM|nr:iron-sulfur cluster assembly scaffold protein [Spiribacter halobius]PWG62604.1 SUF system NifU family Fe-S cluster assembly protein [Spiribacter halobius]UEX78477.1 iron-sulfur cluster assembly scaffold protein [Spiribacter halobius]